MYQRRAGGPILRIWRWRAMSCGQLVASDQVHYLTNLLDFSLWPRGSSTTMDVYQPAERSGEGLTTGQLAIEKFAIGQAVPRVEDPMLLRGHGRYTDDVSLPGQAYAV